jgi:hypothetical protein
VTVLPKSSEAIAEAGGLGAIMTAMRVQRDNIELQIAACRCPVLPFLLLFIRSEKESFFPFSQRKKENIELLLEVRETEACRGERDRGMQRRERQRHAEARETEACRHARGEAPVSLTHASVSVSPPLA